MANPNPLNQFKPGQTGNPKGRPKREWNWSGLIKNIEFAEKMRVSATKSEITKVEQIRSE